MNKCTNEPFLFLHLLKKINSFLMLWIEQSPDDVIQAIERLQYLKGHPRNNPKLLTTLSVGDWLFSIKD